MQKLTGKTLSGGGEGRKERSSNLELYRIICMMLIVANHYVVHSGLIHSTGPMGENPVCINTLILWAIGMWGKTGINCFLLITGYFMCASTITLRKFIKLTLWMYFYNIVIYIIFLFTGYESLSPNRLIQLGYPVFGCFIGFWLTIPFWNILIHNMTKRQHELLLCLLLGMYSLLGSIPQFNIAINYVTWFGIIYLLSSYIRLYPHPIMLNKNLWMLVTLAGIALAICSMVVRSYSPPRWPLFFVVDSNKILSVLVAVASFLWFKNIDIAHNKRINAIGASTFGVLLIHDNSDAMKKWLWEDTVDCVGHYGLSPIQLVFYVISTVIIVFVACIIIDRIRYLLVEEPFFRWYDKKPRFVRLQEFLK